MRLTRCATRTRPLTSWYRGRSPILTCGLSLAAVDVGGAAGEVGKAKEIVYTRIIPALGVALLIGNVYRDQRLGCDSGIEAI